jgi:hypothetical protein
MLIYLAYYKDIIFSSVVLCDFVGMLTMAYDQKYHQYDSSQNRIDQDDISSLWKWLLIMTSLTGFLTISMMCFDLDRSFYLHGKA